MSIFVSSSFGGQLKETVDDGVRTLCANAHCRAFLFCEKFEVKFLKESLKTTVENKVLYM